jgi:hypothetical protein
MSGNNVTIVIDNRLYAYLFKPIVAKLLEKGTIDWLAALDERYLGARQSMPTSITARSMRARRYDWPLSNSSGSNYGSCRRTAARANSWSTFGCSSMPTPRETTAASAWTSSRSISEYSRLQLARSPFAPNLGRNAS